MSTVHVVKEGGAFTAYDEETGTEVRGATKSLALVALAMTLEKETDGTTITERYEELSTKVQRRAERENVSDAVVEDAIEWARRQ